VDAGDIIIALVVVVALGFDFTNGFHDTANAMATTIATGALRPKLAVTIAALLNFVGAFISLKVAATVAEGIVQADAITPSVVFGGLVGAVVWNLGTWWFGLPSSSSHALIGGVVGATLVAAGSSAVDVDGIVSKVIVPALVSPVLAGAIAAVGVLGTYALIRRFQADRAEREFRWAQVASSSMVALAHGTDDAQKTMRRHARAAAPRRRRRRRRGAARAALSQAASTARLIDCPNSGALLRAARSASGAISFPNPWPSSTLWSVTRVPSPSRTRS
jgi:inorganic phosphate transporter, PiT family